MRAVSTTWVITFCWNTKIIPEERKTLYPLNARILFWWEAPPVSRFLVEPQVDYKK